LEAIAGLQAVGYRYFLIYDNFGHFMGFIDDQAQGRFADLNRYLMSHLFFGRQIFYFDVCALSGCDADLAHLLHRLHRDMLDSHIGKAIEAMSTLS
jgi:hypothetical protein